MFQHIKVLLSIIITTFNLLAFCQQLTAYSEEETKEIKSRQKRNWDQISTSFYSSQQLTFAIDTRLDFVLSIKQLPETIKMRAKSYFMDENKLQIQHRQLSPFDSSKVYIYSQNGLIIKSEQFYTSFAFKFSVKANQKYRVVFVDGPPGPKKIIFWEIQYEKIKAIHNVISYEYFKQIQSRINAVYMYFQQMRLYWNFENLLFFRMCSQNIEDSNYYIKFLIGQSILIILVVLFQIKMIQRILSHDTVIL